MSLNWNVADVKDQSKCWLPPNDEGQELMTSQCNSLIWFSLAVDLPCIDSNRKGCTPADWARRGREWDQATGETYWRRWAEDGSGVEGWTPDEAFYAGFEGLRTNVSKTTDAAWRKRLALVVQQTARDKARTAKGASK